MTHTIQPSVKLTQVDVFRTQALLTHQVTLLLSQDQSEVEFVLSELPLATLDSSVRLAPSQPGTARVMDIQIGLATQKHVDLIRTTSEQTVVDLLRQKLRLTLSLNHESSTIDYLTTLQPNLIAANQMPERLAFQKRPLDSWQAFSSALYQQVRSRRAERREIERQLRDVDEQIHQASLELENENQHDQEVLAVLRKSCRIRIQCLDAAPALQLTLSYLVQGAQWVPEYELRVYQDRDEAELVLKALVAQRTGQDWHQVPLAFSTSDLSRSTALPTLDSWRISKVQTKRFSSWRPLPQGLDELFVAYDQSKKSTEPNRQHQLPLLPTLPPLIDPTEDLLSLPTYQSKELHQQAYIEDTVSHEQPEPSDLEDEFYPDGQADSEATVQTPYPSSLPPQAPQEMIQALAPSREQPSLMTVSFGKSNLRPLPKKASKRERRSGQFSQPQTESDEVVQHTDRTLEASELALTYQTLRMQAAEHAQRGQLTFAGIKERFLEEWTPADADNKNSLSHIPEDVWENTLDRALGPSHFSDFPPDSVRITESIGHFCVRYPMDGLGSVAADGKLHSLSLLRTSESIKRIYRCVPAIEQHVYQMVEFENPLQETLVGRTDARLS